MPEMSKSPVKALVERIWTVADLYPTREATAQSAGVSNPQLNRYVNGRAKISLIIVLIALNSFDSLSIKLRQRQDLMRTIYDMDSKR